MKYGSAGYAAPEQYCGGGQTDPRSDIYSLGATLFHLLTGKPPHILEKPFIFPLVKERNPGLSHTISLVVAKCLEIDQDRRYQSAVQLKQDLESCLSSLNHRTSPAVHGRPDIHCYGEARSSSSIL
jgi:serine/threonine protein kinase